jgi:hypothetical protein
MRWGSWCAGQLIHLRGLDRADVKDLIQALSGVVPPEAQAAAVHERTEGNPLFVREIVRLLATEAALEQPGRIVPIPDSVRAVIGRRLAPLSADAVQVLSAAAVAGSEFDLSLVGPACELPAGRVLDGLSEAVALGVVAEEDTAVGGYRFSHSLCCMSGCRSRPGCSCIGGSVRGSRASTAPTWGRMSPSWPVTSQSSQPLGRPPRRLSTPAGPASGPWGCTPMRRPPPSTGGHCMR